MSEQVELVVHIYSRDKLDKVRSLLHETVQKRDIYGLTEECTDYVLGMEVAVKMKILCKPRTAIFILNEIYACTDVITKNYLFLKNSMNVPIGVFKSTEEAENVLKHCDLNVLLYKWIPLDTYTNFSLTIGNPSLSTEFTYEIGELFRLANGWKPVAVTKFWE